MSKYSFMFLLTIFFAVDCFAESYFSDFTTRMTTPVYNFKKACKNSVSDSKNRIKDRYNASAEAVSNAYIARVVNPIQSFKGSVTSTAQKVRNGIKTTVHRVKIGAKGTAVLTAFGLPAAYTYAYGKKYGYCLTGTEQYVVDCIDQHKTYELDDAFAGYIFNNCGKLNTRRSYFYREYLMNKSIENQNMHMIHKLLCYKYPEQAEQMVHKTPKLQLVANRLCGDKGIQNQVDILNGVVNHPEVKQRESWSFDYDKLNQI